jgi:hypothetical protein
MMFSIIPGFTRSSILKSRGAKTVPRGGGTELNNSTQLGISKSDRLFRASAFMRLAFEVATNFSRGPL